MASLDSIQSPPPSQTKRRALIIGGLTAETLRRQLAESGYLTDAATPGTFGRVISGNIPDVVLIVLEREVDAETEAVAVARRLREEPGTHALPLVLVYVEEERVMRSAALNVGVDDCFGIWTPHEQVLARLDALFWRIEAGRRAASMSGDKRLEIDNFMVLLEAVREDIRDSASGSLALIYAIPPSHAEHVFDKQIRDRTLAEAHGFFKLNLRRMDAVGFYGPTTLLIYLPRLAGAEASSTLMSLRASFLSERSDSNLAIGIASFPDESSEVETLIELAETAAGKAREKSATTGSEPDTTATAEPVQIEAEQTAVSSESDQINNEPEDLTVEAASALAEAEGKQIETVPDPVEAAPVEITPEIEPVPATSMPAPVEAAPESADDPETDDAGPTPAEPSPVVEPDPEPIDPMPAPVEPAPHPIEPVPGPVDPIPVPSDPTPVPLVLDSEPSVPDSVPSDPDPDHSESPAAPVEPSPEVVQQPPVYAAANPASPPKIYERASHLVRETPQAAHYEIASSAPLAQVTTAIDKGAARAAAEKAAARERDRRKRGVAIPRRLLLTVSDAARMAQLNALVRSAGYEARTAFDGQQALDLLRIESPDVLLLDFELRGIDGLEMLRRLHKQTKGKLTLPIVMLLPPSHLTARREALELGARGIVALPYDPAELLDSVRLAGNAE